MYGRLILVQRGDNKYVSTPKRYKHGVSNPPYTRMENVFHTLYTRTHTLYMGDKGIRRNHR